MSKDKHIRMVIEFDVDQEALDEHGLTEKDILSHLTFVDDDVVDGFRLSTCIPGLDPTSNFFLCDGTVVSKKFIRERSRDDGLDHWRDMIREELDINGICYNFSNADVKRLQADEEFIDQMAQEMNSYYAKHPNKSEYDTLNALFEEKWLDIIISCRLDRLNSFTHDVKLEGTSVFVHNVKISLAEDGSLLCQFPDETFARPLKSRIQDIKQGDAFFIEYDGVIHIANSDSHQNFDEADTPWFVYDSNEASWFEEDINRSFILEVTDLLHLSACVSQKTPLDSMVKLAEQKAAHQMAPEKKEPYLERE